MASSTLYAPSIGQNLIAFVIDKNGQGIVDIPYSISKFNTSNEYKAVQVSITYQASGATAVDTNNIGCKTGVILKANLNKEDNIVSISSDFIRASRWEYNVLYKIQIRLSKIEYDNTDESAWVVKNADLFSEWSTAAIIKPIDIPCLKVPFLYWDSASADEHTIALTTSSSINFEGIYYYKNNSQESLSSYHCELWSNNKIIETSPQLFLTNTSNNNTLLHYIFKTELDNDKHYLLKIHIITKSGYKKTFNITFQSIFSNLDDFALNISSPYNEEEIEEGYAKILIKPDDEQNSIIYSGTICIRRSSEKDSFLSWEDIQFITLKNVEISSKKPYIFYDFTLESDIKYRYGIQEIKQGGTRSALKIYEKEISKEFQHSYLLGENNQQLKLKFNNTISSFKEVVSDSKQDTIGGRFPFITRNGNMRYKNFMFTGLISYEMDEASLFTQDMPSDIEYDASHKNYFAYEKQFRQIVIDFLNNGKVKLFKSPQEGNILIRLTDVNLTPEQGLNRLIYNFTANAFEIAEDTFENYKKYNLVQNTEYFGENQEGIKIGSINGNYYFQGQEGYINISEIIQNQYNKYIASLNSDSYQYSINNIYSLSIKINDIFSSSGYISNTSLLNVNRRTGDKKIYLSFNSPSKVPIINQYTFDEGMDLSGEDNIYLYRYQGQDSDLYINLSINFVYDEKIITFENAESEIFSTKIFNQITTDFVENESILDRIREYYLNENSYLKLLGLNKIKIQKLDTSYPVIISLIDSTGKEVSFTIDQEIFEQDDIFNYKDILLKSNNCKLIITFSGIAYRKGENYVD